MAPKSGLNFLTSSDHLDAIIGERGVQLSDGLKQRVVLARVHLWQPSLLILDAPLSVADAESEIRQSIEKVAAERSLLLIPHRVAAAARCPASLVMDRVCLMESGPHEELLTHDGVYAAFAEEQRMASELGALGAADLPSREVRP